MRTHLPSRSESRPSGGRGTPLPGSRLFAGQPSAAAPPVTASETAGRPQPLIRSLASGGGRPLPGSVRERMERTLGHDFSGVRVHEGPQAEALGAIAFTRGHDLHFAPGRFSPGSREGMKLLAHELAHVVQQRAGRAVSARRDGTTINDDPRLEAEADAAGARALSGSPASGVDPAPKSGADPAASTAAAAGGLLPSPGAPVQRNGGDPNKKSKYLATGGLMAYSSGIGYGINHMLKKQNLKGSYQRSLMGMLLNRKMLMKAPWPIKLATGISTLGMGLASSAIGGTKALKRDVLEGIGNYI